MYDAMHIKDEQERRRRINVGCVLVCMTEHTEQPGLNPPPPKYHEMQNKTQDEIQVI